MAAHHQRFHRRPFLPTHAHPADPAAVHQRADELGKAAADAGGALDDATLAHLIAVLAQASTALGYPGDVAGLKTRLAWTAADSRAGRERARRWSERQVRYAAIAAITRGLPHHSVLHAATQANAAAELPMSEADVEILVKVECAIEARRAGCDCCSRARPAHG